MPREQQPSKPTPADSGHRSVALSLRDALQQAAAAYQGGQLAQSEQLCRLILGARPGQFEAQYLLGVILAMTQRTAEAAELLRCASTARPAEAGVHNDYGNVLRELGRRDEALDCYDRALRLKPDYVEACFNRAGVLHDLRRFEAALADYVQAIKLRPDFAEAYVNRGSVLHDLQRLDDALDSYRLALQIKPEFVQAHINQGIALHELGRFEEALASYERAISLRLDSAEACNNRAVTLQKLGRFEEALTGYERALEISPGYAEAHYNYAGALKERERHDEALASYQRALALKPDYPDAHTNLGIVQHKLGRLEDALESYERALRLRPDAPWLYGSWLHTKMQLCEWSGYDSALAELTGRIINGQRATGPFPLLALSDSPALQLRAAEIWSGHSYPERSALPPIAARHRRDTIRVGYFSADFQDHATAHLAAELFERHDRRKFEITAFSFGADDASAMRRRLERAFGRFLDVRAQSSLEIARMARQLEIDIAVDLMGFTQNERTEVFAHRAAPIQVSYLGYPGTMGTPCIDYLVADHTLIPEQSRQFYAEKIAYMPDSYQINDRQRPTGGERQARTDLGLPPTGFVYCCFNSSYKITPETFDGWMRVLGAVDGSVLWLLGGNRRAAANLRRRAEGMGVDGARLILAGRLPLPQHLARYSCADLFLDTFPCNAHTTASEALWSGLPVLTRIGATFAARVAASLLYAVGLPELVTTTQHQYERAAIELGGGPAVLTDIRRRLEASRLTTPLFDSELYTRRLEAAYEQMYTRHEAGLAPEHLFIAR